MNVLSLFNGFGGAFLALQKANVRVNKLYVSEIDKHAIKAADAINPNNINLGSVVDIDVSKLDKIDFICGGSPCQSFSFAGKRKGMSTKCELKITTLEQYLELKENNFEFEGQSFLFWEYMRILKDVQKYNPDVIFFLENVVMTKDWEYILSEAIGIKNVMINSSRVSAQNRKRLYWSNIKTTTEGFFNEVVQDIEQPDDLGILLKDVLEDEVDEKYYLSDNNIKFMNGDYSGKPRFERFPNYLNGKAGCICATNAKGLPRGVIGLSDTIVTGCDYRTDEGFRERKNGKTGTLAARAREDESCGQLVKESLIVPEATENNVIQLNMDKSSGGKQPYQHDRVYADYGKSPALDTDSARKSVYNKTRIRRLTPRECFRLQTVAENHIDTLLKCGVSNSQLYKMCGNGWSIDVIAHFFKEINNVEAQQKSLF